MLKNLVFLLLRVRAMCWILLLQANARPQSASVAVLQLQRSTAGFNCSTSDSETKPYAACITTTARIQSDEWIEHALQVLFGNTRPFIIHLNHHFIGIASYGDGHRAAAMAACVFNQIADRAPDCSALQWKNHPLRGV